MPPEMHSHKAKVAVPKLQKYLRFGDAGFQVRVGVKPGSWDVGITLLDLIWDRLFFGESLVSSKHV